MIGDDNVPLSNCRRDGVARRRMHEPNAVHETDVRRDAIERHRHIWVGARISGEGPPVNRSNVVRELTPPLLPPKTHHFLILIVK